MVLIILLKYNTLNFLKFFSKLRLATFPSMNYYILLK